MNPQETKVIRVNPSVIHSNYLAMEQGRPQDCKPAIVVELPGRTISAYRVEVLGPSVVVQNDVKLSVSGARVWIETQAEIEIHLTPD